MNPENLATELLHEIKMSAKRWFIAFLVMVGVEACTIAGFLWYITLPVDEVTYTQEMDEIDGSTATQVIGGDYNGTDETNGKEEEKSDKE